MQVVFPMQVLDRVVYNPFFNIQWSMEEQNFHLLTLRLLFSVLNFFQGWKKSNY